MNRLPRVRSVVTLLAVSATLACPIRLIDNYSKEAEDGLLGAYAKVEGLFDAIAESNIQPNPRAYVHFAQRYSEINGAIQVQVLRESVRPLNTESYGIITQIDTVFTRYRDEHKKNNDVSDFLLTRHRDNMRRMFGAALRAERVRKDEGNP